jgi:hypothetical protein
MQFSDFCGVGNERKMKEFPKINVHFALCGVGNPVFFGNQKE